MPETKLEEKKKKPLILLFSLIVLALIGCGIFALNQTQNRAGIAQDSSSSDITEPEQAELEKASVQIDAQKAIKDRILGDPNAPIKITEYSSFTCSHCGHFHNNTYVDFKKNYIDTGKAYLVFSDFPLNAPALHASMIARCLPEDKYFDFVQELYTSQESWAFESNYQDILEQKAEPHGLNKAAVKECLDNKAIQEGILNRMRAAQAQWQINSTPSFVVNNKTLISGAMPYEQFAKAIEDAVAGKTPEQAGSPETKPEELPKE